MRRVFSLVIILSGILFGSALHAQCIPDTINYAPGIYQEGNYCFMNGIYNQQVWQFVNDSFYNFDGDSVRIDSIRIDTIANLPCGLHFVTNKSGDSIPNIFYPGEHGCFTVYGNTYDSTAFAYDSTGMYNLDLLLYAWIAGDSIPTFQHLGYLHRLDMRIIDSGAVCTALDTTIAGHTSGCYYLAGIQDVQLKNATTSNYPNPFTESTTIKFSGSEYGQTTLKVFNVVGNLQREESFNAIAGNNNYKFERKNLVPGIYFYNLNNGRNILTSKMVIID